MTECGGVRYDDVVAAIEIDAARGRERMTQPDERTRALLRTRDLLEALGAGGPGLEMDCLQQRAIALLRHFPTNSDVYLSARALPMIWADPTQLSSDW